MARVSELNNTVQIVNNYGDVSRETLERLQIYVDLVLKWQPAQNLVASSTIPDIWLRHIVDSLQTKWALPDAKIWVDIGSGAGFPGIVTAILQAGDSAGHVHLIESNQRKAAFLRTVLRETGSKGTVHAERIESVAKEWSFWPVDAISARALAALDHLLTLCEPLTSKGAPCVFHKGQDFKRELHQASHAWAFDLLERKSLIDPKSRMLVLSDISLRHNQEGVAL